MPLIETSPLCAVVDGLSYPEGPCPLPNGDILFVEYGRHAVQRYRAGCVSQVWTEPGAGPASVAVAPSGDLWVCAFDGDALIRLSPDGHLLERHDRDRDGAPLIGPNDLVAAPDGSIYATVSGVFDPDRPAAGAVIRVRPGGTPERIADGIQFANGIALRDGALYVAEHFRDRILRFTIQADDSLSAAEVYADLAALAGPHPRLRGPDGIAFGPAGHLYVAHFACARLVVVAPDGSFSALPTSLAHPTNVALAADGSLLVTAFAQDAPPHLGALLRIKPQDAQNPILVDGAR